MAGDSEVVAAGAPRAAAATTVEAARKSLRFMTATIARYERNVKRNYPTNHKWTAAEPQPKLNELNGPKEICAARGGNSDRFYLPRLRVGAQNVTKSQR